MRTDHKNLTFIDKESSAKAKRWKLCVQEYDFFIEHIAGKDNIVADGFSRLLALDEEHLYLHEEFTYSNDIYETIIKVHYDVIGHHGVNRSLEKLRKGGFNWKYMREHVKRFIKHCPCCQKMSYLKTPIHTQWDIMNRWRG